MPGERDTPTMQRADEIAARLHDAEPDWPSAVPADAHIVHQDDPVWADQVVTDDGEQIVRRYNDDDEVWWTTIGWSDASQRMLLRPRQMTEAEHFAGLHSDDDGTL